MQVLWFLCRPGSAGFSFFTTVCFTDSSTPRIQNLPCELYEVPCGCLPNLLHAPARPEVSFLDVFTENFGDLTGGSLWGPHHSRKRLCALSIVQILLFISAWTFILSTIVLLSTFNLQSRKLSNYRCSKVKRKHIHWFLCRHGSSGFCCTGCSIDSNKFLMTSSL